MTCQLWWHVKSLIFKLVIQCTYIEVLQLKSNTWGLKSGSFWGPSRAQIIHVIINPCCAINTSRLLRQATNESCQFCKIVFRDYFSWGLLCLFQRFSSRFVTPPNLQPHFTITVWIHTPWKWRDLSQLKARAFSFDNLTTKNKANSTYNFFVLL